MNEIIFEVTFTSDKKPERLAYYLPLESAMDASEDPLKKIIEIHTKLTDKAKNDAIAKFGDIVDKVINIGKQDYCD